MATYELWRVKYFRRERELSDFYGGFMGIPLAGAILPVAAVILGIGHIGIHIRRSKEINR